jgi:copper transport protein
VAAISTHRVNSTLGEGDAPAARHFQLARSLPAADSEASGPTAVVLWFTQRPQDDATTVRILDEGGEPVPAGALVHDPVDPTVFLLPVPDGLDEGDYTVTWRSMAADGHVVRGEFTFTVVAP